MTRPFEIPRELNDCLGLAHVEHRRSATGVDPGRSDRLRKLGAILTAAVPQRISAGKAAVDSRLGWVSREDDRRR